VQAQYRQADEGNLVIYAKDIFLIYIDVKQLMQRTKKLRTRQ
jgi:hypothetical protein